MEDLNKALTNQDSSENEEQILLYDLSKLSNLLDGDQFEIVDMVDKFIELTPEYSAALISAYEANNIDDLAKSAHKIKSSLELLASENLRSTIKLINEYARTKVNLEKLPDLMKFYQDNVPVLVEQLKVKVAAMKKEIG